jgi:hypothetical protein
MSAQWSSRLTSSTLYRFDFSHYDTSRKPTGTSSYKTHHPARGSQDDSRLSTTGVLGLTQEVQRWNQARKKPPLSKVVRLGP